MAALTHGKNSKMGVSNGSGFVRASMLDVAPAGVAQVGDVEVNRPDGGRASLAADQRHDGLGAPARSHRDRDLSCEVAHFIFPRSTQYRRMMPGWGRGFTGWTPVSRARPLLRDHHRPHRQVDLGFYDLRLPESPADQATLAARYGIDGLRATDEALRCKGTFAASSASLAST